MSMVISNCKTKTLLKEEQKAQDMPWCPVEIQNRVQKAQDMPKNAYYVFLKDRLDSRKLHSPNQYVYVYGLYLIKQLIY